MKHIVPLAVLALIVAGFAYYTLFAVKVIEVVPGESDITANKPDNQPAKNPIERDSFADEGSLYSLLSRGEDLECAITYIPNPLESEITGNIFTSRGDFRGDFVVPTPDLNGQMVSSIIIADGTIWQWTDIDGELIGSQQPINFDTATLERLAAPIGLNSNVQYSCLTWPSVDRTIFEAPATLLFTDAASATFEEGVIFEDQS